MRQPAGWRVLDPNKAMFANAAQHYEDAWRSASEVERQEIITDYCEQLDELGEQKDQLTLKEYWLGILNIWFLEKYGFLKPDEFNGCQFFYDA